MGIPKLMKDLAPYTERAILGKQPPLEVAVSISAVVIDGPSLVYDAYHRQMKSLPEVTRPLAHRDINEAVVDLLNEIQSCGVEIKKIYFDGALPVSKRATRLERLEKHRHALEDFTKTRVMKAAPMDSPKQPANGNALLQALVSYPSHNLKALEPPFMVASAIEHLRESAYSSLIDVIPDEAEVGCIAYACLHQDVAMLSNDTDLVVFPFASTRRVTLVLIHTLEQAELDTDKSILMAECLRPAEISHRMKLSSLHLLAFQRYLDPSASASVIRKRAKSPLTLENIFLHSRDFIKDYSLAPEVERSLPAQNGGILDPRLSELRSQYQNSRHAVNKATTLHMYLPTLFEDPTREAPWAHGSELRQLAYSLFNLAVPSQLQRASLLEYQRRGHRVTGVEVNLLSKEDLLEVFDEDTSFLQHVHPENSAAATMTSWQKLAVQAVNRRRREDGRVTFLPAFHLSACTQAVLYSLRMLRQVADLLSTTAPTSQFVSQDVLKKLATMPALADLMDATQELYPAK